MTNETLKKALQAAHYNNAVIEKVLRGDMVYIFGRADEMDDDLKALEHDIVAVDGIEYFVGVEH